MTRGDTPALLKYTTGLNPVPLKIQKKRELVGHFSKVYMVQWANNGRSLVSAANDGNLIVWNVMTGLKTNMITLKSAWVMACAFSPNEKLVACGGLDNKCFVYDAKSREMSGGVNKVKKELNVHTGYISCCRFLTNERIVTCSGDMSCVMWDVEKGIPLTQYNDHGGDVMSVSVTPDAEKNVFLSGACDNTAKLWDVRSPTCIRTYYGHSLDVNSVQFFPNGQYFGTGSDDSTCRLYDLRMERELMVYKSDRIRCGVTSVDFSRSGRFLFCGYDEAVWCVWDTLTGTNLAEMRSGHQNRVSTLAVSPDGLALVTGSWDNTMLVWTMGAQ